MGIYDNVGNAAIGQGGNYLQSGHQYLVEIARVFVKQGRKGDVFTIAELVVHESDDPKNPPGFKASWTVNMSQDASLGNLIVFFGACVGIAVEDEARLRKEITTAFCEYSVSPQNPLKGKLVEVEVHEIITKAGKPFSKHIWKPTTKQANPVVAASTIAQASAQAQVDAFGAPPAPTPAPTQAVGAPPPPPPPPPVAKVFPPIGWAAHPTAPGYYYKGQDVLSEQQLRAL
jgi:hypothetical protein